MAWYPARRHYFQAVGEDEQIVQGDSFWGVPSLRSVHPVVGDQFLRPDDIPTPEALEPPPLSEVLRGVHVSSDAVMVLPHTCDFYGPEKGLTHRERVVGRIQRLVDVAVDHPDLLRSGDGYGHTFFLPSWADPSDNRRDAFVNFRQITTVDASYLSRKRRLARLSRPAQIALRRRLTQFFTDYAPMVGELVAADERGGLLRAQRALIPVEDLRRAIGEEALHDLLRRLHDPRHRYP